MKIIGIHRSKGFTLMELLISMMVFSILSVMAYAGLSFVIESKQHTEKVAKRLVELQTTFMFIGRDVEQTIGRSVRDGFGDVQPAMQGGVFGKELISFTHAGHTNFLKATRSSLQRVAYRLEDDELLRLSWPMLDQDFNEESYQRVLLKNVKDVEIAYIGRELQEKDQWPSGLDDVDDTLLPRAVIITITTEDLGEIRRVFRIPPGENFITNTAASSP